MNTYPTLPMSWPKPRGHMKIEVDEASNGAIRTRVLSSGQRLEFPLEHPRLTTAEKDTLMDFCAANVGVPFYFSIPGDATVYTMLLISYPVPVPAPIERWNVSLVIRES